MLTLRFDISNIRDSKLNRRKSKRLVGTSLSVRRPQVIMRHRHKYRQTRYKHGVPAAGAYLLHPAHAPAVVVQLLYRISNPVVVSNILNRSSRTNGKTRNRWLPHQVPPIISASLVANDLVAG